MIFSVAAVARNALPPAAFIPGSFSPETLFEEYLEEEGGRPDKLWIVDDANAVLTDWQKSSNGERVAARFLELYDCRPMAESFKRNRKGDEGTCKRTIPETSTSLLFGATFNVARFQGQSVRAGMARRFLYYVADGHGRLITRPQRRDPRHAEELGRSFLKLSSLGGAIDFADHETESMWDSFQHANRAAQSHCNPLDDAKLSRLSSAPMQTLHVAMIFQACRWAKTGGKWGAIEGEILAKAIEHVTACGGAAEFLQTLSDRAQIASDAEVLLAHIRAESGARRLSGSIYSTRSELTKRFCNNPGRSGAWKPDHLYLRLIPELQKRGVAVQCAKRGNGSAEVYAFRMETP